VETSRSADKGGDGSVSSIDLQKVFKEAVVVFLLEMKDRREIGECG
jgi:hypothetical protein